ncbi:MAG: primosomal replication protein N [Pseudomonadota bacterium]|nr:primosomal replication protein N [Pseudomonadota bacterium]
MSRNDVTLSGVVTELEPLRYTPAGIPLLTFRLTHQSRQVEASQERSVSLDLPVMVLGDLAREMAGLTPESNVAVRGFLARRSLKSLSVVLHATAYKLEME